MKTEERGRRGRSRHRGKRVKRAGEEQ
ncbi:hypothetical protein EYF80_061122 [Liparis tanakae]|uniref:Uncharacterized protein n=1 Tax=Liparis tanakae TaxID=230148 RepID=A0A4Z2EJH5_9TELE|nr:hypothetical protein EYF80_061122 [Liparis tanakae]